MFVGEWQKYLLQLKGLNHEPSTGDIPDDIIDNLTDEQKQQLARLHGEAVKLSENLGEDIKDPSKK
jgi:hypothetical protein